MSHEANTTRDNQSNQDKFLYHLSLGSDVLSFEFLKAFDTQVKKEYKKRSFSKKGMFV